MDTGSAVAVVGAGAMGSGIAQVAVAAGHPVYLVDSAPGVAQRTCEGITQALVKRATQGRMDAQEAADAAARLHAATSVEALVPCLLVVEAIAENLTAKRALVEALDRTQGPQTLLGTNTSSLGIDDIAAGATHRERVLGLHFFNPAHVMRLVEVVRGSATSERVLQTASELMTAWGKTPVRCASTPGFIVNRVARPFYGEAQRMVQEGVADPATIDAALRAAGFPMGPLELTDLIGQDINLAVGTSVWERTGHDPRYAPTTLQQDLVAAGHLGRKTGRGIYHYADDGSVVGAVADPDRVDALVGGPVTTDPVARTVAMLVNEAVDLVARGEASAEDVDRAMILGTRYPKGPIAWGRELGYAVVRRQLEQLDEAFPGGRYRPSPALQEAP
ncbi:MAG: 3-hydroxyacyl-CoA dehydrogenase NAD-binding domain-containing protein [Dermatophilaceae bacterium]